MVKINRFFGRKEEKNHDFCLKIKDLLHDYCLKDLEYKYDNVEYFKNGNLLMYIKIFGMINKGWLNTPGLKLTKENYVPFKKLLNFIEQDTEFWMDFDRGVMRIGILFENNIEKNIEDLESMLNAKKYNL
jgi:hypothetical protein